ncbi:hypothetical protein [Falsibacillus pallidus]|uniref:Sporulation lipoprotein YhcN/YlaJ n=1 Tax=Falsibacillus pallidus TaxID=493781 RepID=A0A370GGC6_9BACI|nr:hypothetical protein [Falsibacillus pallidus]RDI42179.1 hypothetical protein DFR59_10518 [Falsibacillus pallidus]
MKKIASLFLISIILAGCSNSSNIPIDPLLKLFEEEGITLSKTDPIKESIFSQSLNGVRPRAYSDGVSYYYFFAYSNEKKVSRALKQFEKKTASMDLINHHKYPMNNLLLFYIYNPNEQKDLDTTIKKVQDRYINTKK